MTLFQNISRIERLHTLLLRQKTGTPEQLAKQLNISRAGLYNMIDELKVYNLPIAYSKTKQTFYYRKEVEINITFSVKIIDNEEDLRNINAGCFIFRLPSKFLDGTNLILPAYSDIK